MVDQSRDAASDRARFRWWDFVLLAFGLFVTYMLVVIAQHTSISEGIRNPELLGRYTFNVLAAYGIAYAIAGRKRVRNWHRFCLWYFLFLIVLPCVAFISSARQ